MRFWTIWTLRGLTLKERIHRTLEWLCLAIADLLPKRLAYWVALRQIGKATMKSENVPATSLDNVLRNLGNVRDGKPLEVFVWHETMRYPEDKHDVHVNVAPSQLASVPKPLSFNDIARNIEQFRKENPNGR